MNYPCRFEILSEPGQVSLPDSLECLHTLFFDWLWASLLWLLRLSPYLPCSSIGSKNTQLAQSKTLFWPIEASFVMDVIVEESWAWQHVGLWPASQTHQKEKQNLFPTIVCLLNGPTVVLRRHHLCVLRMDLTRCQNVENCGVKASMRENHCLAHWRQAHRKSFPCGLKENTESS